jgi:hypothetical protein
MCGGGGSQPDNSDKVASIEATAAREAREAADKKAAADKEEFSNRLNGAYSTGLDTAKQYFASRGLNPNDYIGAITSSANSARSAVPTLDSSPGTYFANLGEQVYQAEQKAKQAQSLRGINQIFGDNYATNRVTNDLDDPTIEALLQENQGTAEQYVKNLLDRGVITNSGYSGALKNVQNQRAGANARLTDIGNGLLEKQRGSLNTIANEGRSKASNLDLGDMFDPGAYSSRADTSFSDFLTNLGTNLRGAAPTDLFSTSGLAGVAGASQGAQNTTFDPKALSGIFDNTDDTTTNQTPATPF